jgi:hypothetical protein
VAVTLPAAADTGAVTSVTSHAGWFVMAPEV